MSKAFIAKIDRTEQIDGANTIQVGYVKGDRVIIGKGISEGEVGVYFPSELQLSEEYARQNNLYRDSDLNRDQDKKGFFENNRRVRAQAFMGVKSEGYFAPLASLYYLGYDVGKLPVGTELSELMGKEICRKYISPRTIKAMSQKKANRFKISNFLEHVDTKQFKYYVDKIPPKATISFHAKVHGTSARVGYLNVTRPVKRTWLDRLLRRTRTTQGYELVVGTRRTIVDTPDKESFHGPEQFRFDWAERLAPYLEKGMTVYGEIIGFANGRPIMGNHDITKVQDKALVEKYGKTQIYAYGCPPEENRFIIYRITMTNEDGHSIDYTVDQLKAWACKRGFEHTAEVHPRWTYFGNAEELCELVEQLTERPEELTECYVSPNQISEGIVVRVDYEDTTPTFYKNKSWAFKVMEGIAKENSVDMEDAS
jgi:hypothetical protein